MVYGIVKGVDRRARLAARSWFGVHRPSGSILHWTLGKWMERNPVTFSLVLLPLLGGKGGFSCRDQIALCPLGLTYKIDLVKTPEVFTRSVE